MTSEATAVPIVRADGRAPDQLRPISITRGWSKQAEGSALIEFGNTDTMFTKPSRRETEDYITGKFG